MLITPVIKSAQKLRYFLAGVFPVLARIPLPWATLRNWTERFAWMRAARDRYSASIVAKHVGSAASNFGVGSYTDDLLDWDTLPREARPLLRTGILLAGLLSLLVPLAVHFDWFPVSVESIMDVSGRGSVGTWDILLWVVAATVGWCALLMGTAAANRIAFLLALALFLYFKLGTYAGLPKSWWTLLIPLQGAIALVFCEARGRQTGWRDVTMSATIALLCGAMIAFVAMIVVPTPPWFRGQLVSATVRIAVPLALICWSIGRWLRARAELGLRALSGRLHVVFALLMGIGTLSETLFLLRGGLVASAQGIVAIQASGWLWPFYAFIGVGVVFKVLRETRTLHKAAQDVVPRRAIAPLTALVLLWATLVSWSDSILLRPNGGWPGWIETGADWIARSSHFFWKRPLVSLTLATMQWVFLALLLLVIWGLIKRRASVGALAAVQFVAIVTWGAVAEYNMEAMAFTRSPSTSALAFFLFIVFVLWLAHKTMKRILTGDSRWWPQASRIAVYAGALIFVVLPLHARAALHDERLSGEIFLYLFSGVLNFGVPFYLMLYASSRFRSLPLTPQHACGLFLAGGAIAVPLIIGDKAVILGSFSAAWAEAGQQVAAALEGTLVTPAAGNLPAWWIAIRSTLGIVAMLLVGAAVRRGTRNITMRPAAQIFAIVAVASGVACFSLRPLDLPLLPNQWLVFLSPRTQTLLLNATFVVVQLAWLIPGFVLALVTTGSRNTRRSGLAVLATISIQGLLLYAWPRFEPWLRSTGTFAPAGVALGILSFVLIIALRDRLDGMLSFGKNTQEMRMVPEQLMTTRELRFAGIATLFVCLAISARGAWENRLIAQPDLTPALGIRVPATWKPTNAPAPGEVAFTRESAGWGPSTLAIAVRSDLSDSTTAIDVATTLSNRYANFSPSSLERWDGIVRGAFAITFTYVDTATGDSLTRYGGAAVAPRTDGTTLVATTTFDGIDDARLWDVARVIQSASVIPPVRHNPPAQPAK